MRNNIHNSINTGHHARSEFIQLCKSELTKIKKKSDNDQTNNIQKPKQNNRKQACVGDIALTPREVDCVKLVVSGKNAHQIGHLLNLSHRTVEYYLLRLRTKTQCRNKSELINYMQNHRLEEQD